MFCYLESGQILAFDIFISVYTQIDSNKDEITDLLTYAHEVQRLGGTVTAGILMIKITAWTVPDDLPHIHGPP